MSFQPFFRRYAASVALGAESAGPGRLRRAQLGAALAVAAQATRADPDVPAQVILPTGSGKTAVLTLIPFLLRPRRVLVVAPSRLIRKQLADAFTTLDDLRTTGVVPSSVTQPAVVVVDGLATKSDWVAWRNADVVVATVNSVSHGFPGVKRVPVNMFDLALFDEAHHVPADAWTALLEGARARSVLATATPFRTDRRPLPGEVVYRYPLQLAIQEEILAPVRYVPVEVDAGVDRDVAVAQATAARLRDPVHVKAESRVLVRTNRRAAAEALVAVYAREGVKLGLILGDTTDRAITATLSQARRGELDGFACVGAMIEGFDFPTLKIAAYHEPHRTLGPTLQFIGRLSRPSGGVRAELLAVREDVEGETRELYESGDDWADLLPGIVDAALDEEHELREYVGAAAQSGSLRVPARAIAPPRQAHVFRCADKPAALSRRLDEVNGAPVIYRFFHAESDLCAFVTRHRHRPRWFRSDALDTPEFRLHVITWVEAAKALFISTESVTDARELVTLVDAPSAKPIGSEELGRLLWAARPDGYHAIGLRTTRLSIARHTSYRSAHGPEANRSISAADADTSTVGHAFAFRRGSGGGTLGFSTEKGKFWEPTSADTFYGFRKWCVDRAREISAGASVAGLPGLPVGLAERYADFPELPLAAVLDHQLVDAGLQVECGGALVPLADLELRVSRANAEALDLLIERQGESYWHGRQVPEGTIDTVGPDLNVVAADTGEVVGELAEWMTTYPPSVFFADGSTVFGPYRQPAPSDPSLRSDLLTAVSWPDVNLKKEHLDDKPAEKTVQGQTKTWARQRFDWLIFDHGTREIADFVAINVKDDGVEIALLHCKASKEAKPGVRVEDLYDVLGQCVRSTVWLASPASLWDRLVYRLTSRPDRTEIIRGGDQARLAIESWTSDPPRSVVEVWAVQPGLKIADVGRSSNVRSLLAGADDQLRLHGARLQVVGHD